MTGPIKLGGDRHRPRGPGGSEDDVLRRPERADGRRREPTAAPRLPRLTTMRTPSWIAFALLVGSAANVSAQAPALQPVEGKGSFSQAAPAVPAQMLEDGFALAGDTSVAPGATIVINGKLDKDTTYDVQVYRSARTSQPAPMRATPT